MQIYSFIKNVCDILGPGNRSVVWVQGCSRHCKGCIAPEMWRHDGGAEIEPQELAHSLLGDEIDGITVSGGEPFEQAEDLSVLLREVKQCGKTTWVYTGYTLEELVAMDEAHVLNALACIDVLVDGPFVEESAGVFSYRGSANQRILYLSDAIPAIPCDDQGGRVQVTLGQQELMIIGVPPPGFLEKFRTSLQEKGVELIGETWGNDASEAKYRGRR